jgi:hypothetical protein
LKVEGPILLDDENDRLKGRRRRGDVKEFCRLKQCDGTKNVSQRTIRIPYISASKSIINVPDWNKPSAVGGVHVEIALCLAVNSDAGTEAKNSGKAVLVETTSLSPRVRESLSAAALLAAALLAAALLKDRCSTARTLRPDAVADAGLIRIFHGAWSAADALGHISLATETMLCVPVRNLTIRRASWMRERWRKNLPATMRPGRGRPFARQKLRRRRRADQRCEI